MAQITRAEIKARLFAASGCLPNSDVLTLAWTPLVEHTFWDDLAAEVEKIVQDSILPAKTNVTSETPGWQSCGEY